MKILITGVAGFIGSNLAEYLLKNGHVVVGVDNFNDYYDPKIKEFNISSFLDNDNFVLYRNDITDNKEMEVLFEKEKVEAVVHLAAWAGVTYSIDNPDIYLRTNVLGTNILAELSVKHGIKSFVFASTSSIYGKNNKTPYKEDMDSSHPLAPYPASKKASEVLLYTYNVNFGLNVTNFRFFNPIGPRLRPDLAISKLIKSTIYDYEFPQYQDLDGTSRDYTQINNMLKAMEYVCENPFPYEIINLGNSNPITLGDLVKGVENVTGQKVKLKKMPERKGEMTSTFANIDKAKNLIGYNPQESLEDMIDSYYRWYLDQPEWYRKFGI